MVGEWDGVFRVDGGMGIGEEGGGGGMGVGVVISGVRVRWGEEDGSVVNGKELSSKTTWREIITLRVVRSRHRYPLCSRG